MKSLDRPVPSLLRNAMAPNTDPSSWPRVSKARLSAWRKLKTKKGRRATGQILVEGVRLVAEALVSNATVEALLVADNPEGVTSARRVLARTGGWSGSFVSISTPDFKRLTDTVHSAGVAAVLDWRPDHWDNLPSVRPRHMLYCDRIADPGNLGTLVRTAAGLGLDAVVMSPGSAEAANPKAIRATAGAVFRIPIFEEASAGPFIAFCRERNFVILIADRGRGQTVSDTTLDRARGWVLVIGGETSGPGDAWNEADVQWLRIPMRRGVESFNAAAAGAILMDRLCHPER